MKKITIKLPGKITLKDCAWLMDEKFIFVNNATFDRICYKEIEIIKENLNLHVCENFNFKGIHDLQIKIIETGEKFYTRSKFISHGETEKVLFVPDIKPNTKIAKTCDNSRMCNGLDCKDCFFSYPNQKLWRETL